MAEIDTLTDAQMRADLRDAGYHLGDLVVFEGSVWGIQRPVDSWGTTAVRLLNTDGDKRVTGLRTITPYTSPLF